MRKLKKWMILICGAVMMLALTACGSTEVDVAPYLSVNFSGFNGKATANADFDFAEFEHGIMSQWKDDEKSVKKLAELTALETTFQLEPKTTEGVSNGDTITVKMTYNEEKAKELGYSFTNTEKTIQVEGLQEAIPVDPFDEAVFGPEKEIDLEIMGCSPYLSVFINNNASDIYKSIAYQVDVSGDQENGNLKNGDTVKITASLNSMRADEYELTRTELDVPIEGIESYLTDVSMLSQNGVQELKNQMQEELEKRKQYTIELFTDDPGVKKYFIHLDSGVTCGDLLFTGSAAVVDVGAWAEMSIRLVVPFQLAFDNVSYHTTDGTKQTLSFPDACGYFVVNRIHIDKNGDLIPGHSNVELGNWFENQQLMDQALEQEFGEMTYGSFN